MQSIQVNNVAYQTISYFVNQAQQFRQSSSDASRCLFNLKLRKSGARRHKEKSSSVNSAEGSIDVAIFTEAMESLNMDPRCLRTVAKSLHNVLHVGATSRLFSPPLYLLPQMYLPSPRASFNFSVLNNQSRSISTLNKPHSNDQPLLRDPPPRPSEALKSQMIRYRNAPDEQRALVEGYLRFHLDNGTQRTYDQVRDFFFGVIRTLAWVGLGFFLYNKFSQLLEKDLKIEVQVKELVSQSDVTFDDVQGCDEAKQQLQDVVEFLRDPSKFTRLGAKLPKGVLFVGPPGVGKTLLAKAVAGEANVSFLHACGSEFDDAFVGIGASRVRKLFKHARENAPCVVFIDEFDAVAKKRSKNSFMPRANQTINQLLSEMDGFHNSEGVIVLGATNLRENLDEAVLRPGRFDMEVNIAPPNVQGRMALFKLYLEKIRHDAACDAATERLANGTTGFTGADIQNIINQAAIHAGINGRSTVTVDDIWYARDKAIAGPARKRLPDEECNKRTAYHEVGHALVAHFTSEADELHQVTILARNMSLGHTSQLPGKEMYGFSKSELQAKLDVLMGGRVAEEIIFGPNEVGTGASDDLERATRIAESMVKQYGMSPVIGPRVVDHNEEHDEELSATMKEAIDSEVRRILQESYERTQKVLREHLHDLHVVVEALLKYETLNKDDVEAILSGREPKSAGAVVIPEKTLPETEPLPTFGGAILDKSGRL